MTGHLEGCKLDNRRHRGPCVNALGQRALFGQWVTLGATEPMIDGSLPDGHPSGLHGLTAAEHDGEPLCGTCGDARDLNGEPECRECGRRFTGEPEPLVGGDGAVVPFGPGAILPLGGEWLPGDVAVSIEAHEDHDTAAVLTLILSEGDAGTVRLLAELTRADCLALADRLAEIAEPEAGPPSVTVELSPDQGNCPNGHACELRLISVNHRDVPVVPYSRSCGVEDCGYHGPALYDRVTRQNATAEEAQAQR